MARTPATPEERAELLGELDQQLEAQLRHVKERLMQATRSVESPPTPSDNQRQFLVTINGLVDFSQGDEDGLPVQMDVHFYGQLPIHMDTDDLAPKLSSLVMRYVADALGGNSIRQDPPTVPVAKA